jgi:nucleotide-binding universal stress UspA family protein
MMEEMMLPFRRILWPTDFSDASYQALQAANELASHFKGELILLHVVHPIAVVPSPDPGQFNGPAYQRAVEAHALKTLQDIAKKMVSDHIKVRPGVLMGSAANIIVDSAAKEQADLIVISTHGETGLQRFVFGSVAEKVVRLAGCPVLVIQATSQ